MAKASRSWQPILDGSLAERCREVVEDVVQALGEARREVGTSADTYPIRVLNTPVLARGTSGPALFFTYLDQALPGQGHGETALDFLELSIHQMSQLRLGLALFEGLLSTAWVAEHLAGRAFEPEEGDDFNEEIDELLCQVFEAGFDGEYDLVVGLVGIGVYALERLPRARARELLAAVVGELETRVEKVSGGVTWWTPPNTKVRIDSEIPRGHYNLGVAHGVPGVIGFFADLLDRGVECERVLPLLEGAVDWLLGYELDDHETSFFCDRLVPGAELYPTRTGWCYGDPGIVMVLLRAARAAGRSDWEAKALDIAREVAVRPFDKTLIDDAGLCHGAAGVAHVFNRLFHATGEELFRQAAMKWFRQTLEMRRPGEGFAGYSMWSRQHGEVMWLDDPGFLNGAAGIALAVLAGLTPVEPAWDRVMLLDVAPLARC